MAIFANAGVGNALVGEEPAAVVVADADQFAFGAQGAAGCVVEGVALEAARGYEMEADEVESGFERSGVGNGKLDLGLDSGHGRSIRHQAVGDASGVH